MLFTIVAFKKIAFHNLM